MEAGKMPSDNLACRIALDTLGAGVPTDDPSLRVEHRDGVVSDSFDEEAKALIALTLGPHLAAPPDQEREHNDIDRGDERQTEGPVVPQQGGVAYHGCSRLSSGLSARERRSVSAGERGVASKGVCSHDWLAPPARLSFGPFIHLSYRLR